MSMKWSLLKVFATNIRDTEDEGAMDSDPTRISSSLEIVPFVGEVHDSPSSGQSKRTDN